MISNMIKTTAAIVLGVLLSIGAAFAQSSPNLTFGMVPTPAQWNSYFIAKNDTLGYVPLNTGGGIMTGRLVTAAPSSTTGGFNLTCGSVPASPVNGDQWCTTAGLFVQINGTTVGPLSGAASGGFSGTSPIKVTFPAGVVTYAFDFTVANTFLAQQTAQGATTTSPGWYTQISGDTTPRVRVGLNATDIPSIAFGSGSAVRDTFIERVGAANIRLGAPDAAAPVAQTLSVQNVATGTSNTVGADLTFQGAKGTGTGTGGKIVFQTAPGGSTGSSQNPEVTALTISSGGGLFTGGASDPGTGNLNLAGGSLLNNGTSPTGTGAYVRATAPTVAGMTLSAALTYGGVTLSNAVSGTGNMALTANTTFTGTTTVSTLAPTTINAFTLAGTIAGGGNQVNNVVIGTSTPLAGTFTTLGSGTHTITSAGSSALAVGLNGATNPALQIDASAATMATGIKIAAFAAGGGSSITTISSGTNESMAINTKGSGTLSLNNSATGGVVVGGATGGDKGAGSINVGSLFVNGVAASGTGTVTSVGLVSGTANVSGTCTITSSGTCAVVSQTAPASWTPTDASGAGLTFTGVSANWTQVGNMVYAYGNLTYPSTANGSNALIGGLPVTVPNNNGARQCSVTFSTAPSANFAYLVPTAASTNLVAFLPGGSANTTNAQLTTAVVRFLCVYPAT